MHVSSCSPQLDESVVSREAESLRKVVQEIDDDMDKLTRERDEKRDAAGMDYGPQRAFFALKEQCIEKRIEVVSWSLSPLLDGVGWEEIKLNAVALSLEIPVQILRVPRRQAGPHAAGQMGRMGDACRRERWRQGVCAHALFQGPEVLERTRAVRKAMRHPVFFLHCAVVVKCCALCVLFPFLDPLVGRCGCS